MATIPLPPEFREFLKCLNSVKAEYLLIGGHAVGAHGHVRATMDMDVWIAASPENADRVKTALRTFGFSPDSVDALELARPRQVVRMGVKPFQIDIVTSIAGVEFEACYPRRVAADADGVPVPLIHLDDLLANKRATGRLKDQADVAALLELE